MNLAPYRAVLALPGVRGLSLLALVARMPVVSIGVVFTLHVVVGLGYGYGPAGLVGAAGTIGTALGAPALGRVVDRYGLRRMLGVTTVAQAAFWACAPWLPYAALLVAAFVGGLLTLPVFSVVRQALAAMVPEGRRRAAYSLDSMSVELSFMVGPVVAVLVCTQLSTTVAMLGIGVLVVASGVALYALNPPVKSEGSGAAGRVPVRVWLRPAMVAVFVATTACTLVLAGADVAVVAALQSTGQVSWVGLVLALWGFMSLVGGFVYGAIKRSISGVLLALVMAAFTIPVGLFGNTWWVLCLALIPAGVLCAPTLAALADEISRLAPESVRGLVMGLHGSALTAGFAIGAPLGGAVIDAAGPSWAFAVTGVAGLALALAALAVVRGRLAPPASMVLDPQPAPHPAPVPTPGA
ncbi:MAG TPA: MFS transporter [Pseudonocardiaceae bacterium]